MIVLAYFLISFAPRAAFAADADFVNIRGEHHRSPAAIAADHQAIFDSIYKGSRVHYELHARALNEGVILVSRAELHVPAGPLAGDHISVLTTVIVRDQDWKVTAFHNTLVAG